MTNGRLKNLSRRGLEQEEIPKAIEAAPTRRVLRNLFVGGVRFLSKLPSAKRIDSGGRGFRDHDVTNRSFGRTATTRNHATRFVAVCR
jgi:hypothetical protein